MKERVISIRNVLKPEFIRVLNLTETYRPWSMGEFDMVKLRF